MPTQVGFLVVCDLHMDTVIESMFASTSSIAWWCSPLLTATSRTDGLPRRFGTGTPGAAINKGEQGLAPADLGGSTG
jgi:hypothetical protein